MAANRKLLTEIQQVLKKVEEGVSLFDELYDKVYAADSQALKEKYENELKKEIKKLQRLRDQIKAWASSNEIKDKNSLVEARKLIESKMESFKVCERDTKTKAYSKEGLARDSKLDPREQQKEDTRTWLNGSLDKLHDLNTLVDGEKEKLAGGKIRGKAKEALERLENRLQKHRWHMTRLELMLKLLENDEIEPQQLDSVKDSVEYYLETAIEDDGQLGAENEFDIYEELDLESFGTLDSSAAAVAEREKEKEREKEEKEKAEKEKADKEKAEREKVEKEKEAKLKKEREEKEKREKKATEKDSSKSAKTPVGTAGAPSVAAIVAGTANVSTTVSTSSLAPAVSAHTPATPTLSAIVSGSVTSSTTSSVSGGSSTPTNITATSTTTTLAPAVMTMAAAVKNAALPVAPTSMPSAPTPSPNTASGVSSSIASASSSNSLASLGVPSTMASVSSSSSLAQLVAGASTSSVPSTATPTVVAAAAPAMTPEMLNVYAQLKQSSIFATESDTTGYVPRNAYSGGHSSFPTTPIVPLSEQSALFDKLPMDTLFFAFYHQQNTQQQALAARRLKKSSWRFHKKYSTWFQRHSEPKATAVDSEEGAYVYFDYETGWCQRLKSDFKFEYAFLEDELSLA